MKKVLIVETTTGEVREHEDKDPGMKEYVFGKHYINPALEMGLIVMGVPDKPTSRNQTYIRK